MADLVGSIHQFLNNCKDTIVSWCKDAAKTVCLPLSGGSMNSGANITTTGTVTSGKVVVDTNTNIDNGALNLRAAANSDNIVTTDAGINLRFRDDVIAGSGGSAPPQGREMRIAFKSGNNKDLGYLFSRVGTSKLVEQIMCVRSYDDPSQHWHLAINHSPTLGVYTYAPHPMKLDTSSNTFVINPDDNSNKIATTYWVNQALANMTKGYNTSNGTRYIKFPNGLMICAGYAANVTAGSVVNFPAAFKNMPDVVIVRHWGGTGDSTVGASSTVGSAPVQVYNTTVSSFRVGVHTATATDSTAYINGSYTIYAMWIAVGEWK